MLTKEQREEMRIMLIHCNGSPLDQIECYLVSCLNDLDERDKQKPMVKLCVFSDGATVIVVGLDKFGEPIDSDGTLFGPESGRNIEEFDKKRFSPSKGEVVIVDPRSTLRVV